MKLDKRARRLGEYLEGAGWEVYERRRKCKQCGYTTAHEDAYCKNCGGKMKRIPDSDDEGLWTLMEALRYADEVEE